MVLSSALVIRRSLICELGGFDENFGVGARWGGSEETDLLLRMLDGGSSISYFPSLLVFHPKADFSLMSYKDTFTKSYTYGLGRGALLRKHKTIPKLFIFNCFIKPAGAIFLSLLLVRPKDVLRFCSSLFGRVVGFVKYQRSNYGN